MMTIIRCIVLLTGIVFVSGCSVLENMMIGDPTDTPISIDSTPPTLYMLRGDIAFPMDMGSYCWVTGEQGICVDVFPPSYTSEMHTLVIGNTLELMFDMPFPDTVTTALHPGSNLMTRIADIMAETRLDENGIVLVTVPENLDGNYVLTVSAFWAEDDMPHGDAFYTAPVRFSP